MPALQLHGFISARRNLWREGADPPGRIVDFCQFGGGAEET
jgi:hypothetical protein